MREVDMIQSPNECTLVSEEGKEIANKDSGG